MEINRKKLIYAILREINKNSEIKYNAETFKVEESIFNEVLLIIKDENFAKGISIYNADNIVKPIIIEKPQITLKGIEFLEDNSNLKKIYKGIKEIREWIKL